MALILTTHDLSTGSVFSSEVTSPNNWRVTGIPAGCPTTQVVFAEFWVQGDNGDFVPLTDNEGATIKIKIYGSTHASVNPVLINAAKGKIKVIPPSGATGTISLDSINS